MINDYINSQKFVSNYFIESVKNDRISHAFLIDCNNFDDFLPFIYSVVKFINCPFHYLNRSSLCNDCVLCDRIDNNSFSDMLVIDSSGSIIKKESVLDLKDRLSKSNLEGNTFFYIIKDCDLMNVQTANSILKVLEEPSLNVVAFLLTNSINKVLPTIRSRCQILKLNRSFVIYDNTLKNFAHILCSSSFDINNYVNDVNNITFVDSLFKFILAFENSGIDCICNSKILWHSFVNSRILFSNALDFLIYFYYDIFNSLNDFPLSFCVDNSDLISEVKSCNNIDSVLKKVNILIRYRDNLVYNPNLNLFFDSLIIEMSDCCV